MIPKRIFFYWSGNNLSWMRYMTLYSFRKMNPDWEMILYLSDNNNSKKTWVSPEEQDFINYKGVNYLEKVEKLNVKIEKVKFPNYVNKIITDIPPNHESDLFRYYQLYKNGGIYCDMDIIFFRSMDSFYKELQDRKSDTVLYQSIYYIATGLLGSSKNNEFYKDLFDYGVNNYNIEEYQSMGVNLIYERYETNVRENPIILNLMKSKFPNLNFFNISTSLIYHYDWTKIEFNFSNAIGIDKFDIKSMGYHWYAGSKIAQFYNINMNETNYEEFNTTFSMLAKYILETNDK